jgi:hypothetical protein
MPSSSNAVFIENGRFVDYFGNPIDISSLGLVGPTGDSGPAGSIGPTGPTGNDSSSSSTTKKVIKEFEAIGDGETLIITRAELETAIGGPVTTSHFMPGGPGTVAPDNATVSYADMTLQFWLLIAGVWYQYNTGGSDIGTSGTVVTTIDAFTGNISIFLNLAPFPFPSRLRVVITL